MRLLSSIHDLKHTLVLSRLLHFDPNQGYAVTEKASQCLNACVSLLSMTTADDPLDPHVVTYR